MTEQTTWRKKPVATTLRVGSSLIRRSIRAWGQPVVPFDDSRSRIVADLATALGLSLYRYGFTSPELDLMRLILAPGDVFVDGGANVGLFTLVAAARVGASGKVIACEPAPATARDLKTNVDLNGYSWVSVKEIALAERAGQEPFYVFEGPLAGLSSFAPEEHGGSAQHIVRLDTLDDMVSGPDRRRLRLIKLDVEGAELRVMKGATDILRSIGPDMLLEVEPTHLARQGSSRSELRSLLGHFGYYAYTVGWKVDRTICLRPYDWVERPASPNVFLTRQPEKARRGGAFFDH